MENSVFSTIIDHYNWLGSLLALAGIIAMSKVGKWLVFKVPALAQMREINRVKDKEKWAREKYPIKAIGAFFRHCGYHISLYPD